MKRPGRTYSRPSPTKAQQRAALTTLLTLREKPLDATALASLSRSFGLPVGEIESIAASVRRGAA